MDTQNNTGTLTAYYFTYRSQQVQVSHRIGNSFIEIKYNKMLITCKWTPAAGVDMKEFAIEKLIEIEKRKKNQ